MMSRSPAAPSSTTPSSESSRDALTWACYAASSRAGIRMLSTPPSFSPSSGLATRTHATRVRAPSSWTSPSFLSLPAVLSPRLRPSPRVGHAGRGIPSPVNPPGLPPVWAGTRPTASGTIPAVCPVWAGSEAGLLCDTPGLKPAWADLWAGPNSKIC